MKLKNPWVGYLDRTYLEIKESILKRLRLTTPELTDLNESNLLVILVSIFSGIGEQLNYYIDDRARESFLATARKFSSAVKLVRLLDYRVRTATPASVDLYFTYVNSEGLPVSVVEPGIIPQGTLIQTSSGMPWVTTKTIEVPIGTSYAKVPAKQMEPVQGVLLGTTTNHAVQEFIIPGEYAQDTIQLTINGEAWENVSTLALSGVEDKHYIIEVGEDRVPRVTFGNGINGAIPPSGQEVIADYFVTEGAEGNNVSRGMVNQLASVLVIPEPATSIIVRNQYPPSGGLDMEDVESIRFNAPLTTKTIERAVTASDYNYLARKFPGVAKAKTTFDCGIYADLFIYPSGGGLASSVLLEGVKEYLDGIQTLGPIIDVKPAGETPVYINLNVYPKLRTSKVGLTNEILETLLEEFSIENSDINGRIAISDVLALVDNLSKVDTVDLVSMYTLPYATPIKHSDPLIWERETLFNSKERVEWRIVYDGANFRLFKGSYLIGIVPTNTYYQDPENIIRINISPTGMYTEGQAWTFNTYPIDKNILLDDNSVPVITSGTIRINILSDYGY